MANLNKVQLIGRLTREPEFRTFAGGGKVAVIGFCVNNSKKNQQTGAWEDEPVWLDLEAFNRQNGQQLADTFEKYTHKGSQCYIEGRLKLDQWTTQQGEKRQKLKIVVDVLQLLDSKPKEEGHAFVQDDAPPASSRQAATTAASAAADSEGVPF